MNDRIERFLFWAPRGLTAALAIFFSAFALDAFNERGALNIAIGLGVHLVPAAIIGITLWLAWRREALGGGLLAALGVGYCVMMWGQFRASVYVAIAGPLLVAGALFLVHARFRPVARSS